MQCSFVGFPLLLLWSGCWVIFEFFTSPSFPSTTHKGKRNSFCTAALFHGHRFKQDSHSLIMRTFPIQAASVKAKTRFDTVLIE